MSERILCMEDDAAQARLVRKCLERAGYVVEIAPDGPTGLAMFEANPSYHAIVIDQTMPGLNGLDVIRMLTTHESAPPMIMVTGTGDEKTAVSAMKLGASDYLVKDFEGGFVEMLPLIIGRAIEQRRIRIERHRMEQELAQDQKLKAIGRLAAGIAHEINTPNQYIAGNARFLQKAFHTIRGVLDAYAELLDASRKGKADPDLIAAVEQKVHNAELEYLAVEIPQAISQSIEGVEHVASIVSAMNEYTHPDACRKQPADLRHIIENAMAMSCNEWKYVADMFTDFEPDLPTVYCLPTDINRVILNLLINAAHATAEANHHGADGKRTISVRAKRDGAWVEIRIEDHGLGIPKEIRDRVFEQFFTTKEVGQGTGQGLSIAYAIVVEKHGGAIHFETEEGRGTTFIVRLPIQCPPNILQASDVEIPVPTAV